MQEESRQAGEVGHEVPRGSGETGVKPLGGLQNPPPLDCGLQPLATRFRLRAREARVLGGWRGKEQEGTGFALRASVLNPGSQFLSVLRRDAWPIRTAWASGPSQQPSVIQWAAKMKSHLRGPGSLELSCGVDVAEPHVAVWTWTAGLGGPFPRVAALLV